MPIEPSKKYNDLPPEHKKLVEKAIALSEEVQANMFKNMDAGLLSQMKIDPKNIDHEKQRAKQREKYSGFTPDQLHSLIKQFEQSAGHMSGKGVASPAQINPVSPAAVAGSGQDKNALIADIAEASFQKLVHANPSDLSAETRDARKNAVINKAGFIAQMSATYQAYPVEILAGIAKGLHEDKGPLVEQPRSGSSKYAKLPPKDKEGVDIIAREFVARYMPNATPEMLQAKREEIAEMPPKEVEAMLTNLVMLRQSGVPMPVAPSNLEKARDAADGVPLRDALGNYSATPKPPANKASEPAKTTGWKF